MATEPTRSNDGAVPDQVGHIELIETPGKDQPWRVRLVDADNHARIFWTEDYLEEGGAWGAIAWLGRFFSPLSEAWCHRGDGPEPEPGPNGSWLHVALRRVGHGASEYLSIPIHHRTVPLH